MTADKQPLERRGLEQPPEVQEASDGRVWLSGCALRFGGISEPIPGRGQSTFRERFAPESLRRLAERRDVKFLHSHDPSKVLGSSRSGTLELRVDGQGLHFRLHPPSSPSGQDLIEAVRRGDLTGTSIGFRAVSDTWQNDVTPPIRTIEDAEIFEISACSWPAYASSGIAVEQRAMDHAAAVWLQAEVSARQSRDAEMRELQLRMMHVSAQ